MIYPNADVPAASAEAPGASGHGDSRLLGVRNLMLLTVFLTVAYFAVSWAVLSLPVSFLLYSTPLWPGAGLALGMLLIFGMRLWPGVWLGTFLLGLWHDSSLIGAGLAAMISVGTTLQAVLGAWLISRFVGKYVKDFGQWRVSLYLLSAGPVACVVSPTVGLWSLWIVGRLAPELVADKWLLWWSGDALGVMLFSPLVLMLWPNERLPWRHTSVFGAIPLVLAAVVILLGAYLVKMEMERTSTTWQAWVKEHVDEIRAFQLPQYFLPLQRAGYFFAASEEVTEREFTTYMAGLLRTPALEGVQWAPRVLAEALDSFEADVRDSGRPDFRVRERGGTEHRPAVDVELRDHFPVLYSTSVRDQHVPLGLDHSSESSRRLAMARARDSGQASIALVAERSAADARVFMAFQPVYRGAGGGDALSVFGRRDALTGYVVGLYSVERLFEQLLRFIHSHSAVINQPLSYRVTDVTDDSRPVMLVQAMNGTGSFEQSAKWQADMAFGGRRWHLDMTSSSNAKTFGPLLVGYQIAAMMAAFLVAFAALNGMNRQFVLASGIKSRTRELEAANTAMRVEMAERKRLQSDLERHFRISQDLVCIAGFDGYFKELSTSWMELLGWSIDELMQKPFLEFVHPEDRDITSQTLERLEQGETIMSFENRFCCRNGGHRLLAWKSSPELERGIIFASAHDITQLKGAEAEAKASNQAKSAFLATMSHEIRTPMNAVLAMSEILSLRPLSEHDADLVKTIHKSAWSLLRLIDDILDFSKIEAGRMELNPGPVSVEELVEGLCSSLASVAAHRGVTLYPFISPTIPKRVTADEMRLRQVIYNLTGNAIKFSSGEEEQQGHVQLRVEVAKTAPLWLRFTVRDNGIGMDAHQTRRIFSAFEQADSNTTRRFGGTGLGLAISKRLVEAMSGELEVDSTPGKGSTFTVTLPFDVPADQPIYEQSNLAGLTCLLVGFPDPEAADLSVYLADAGASSRQPSTLDAAIEEAAASEVPVVIMHDARREEPSEETLERAFGVAAQARHLLLTNGRRRWPRVEAPYVVSLDENVHRRSALIGAVAIAAGRASPEFEARDDPEVSLSPIITPPTIAEARAQGRLILVAEDDGVNQKVILRQLAQLGYAAEIAKDGVIALEQWRQGGYALLLTDLHMPNMDGHELAAAIRQEEDNKGERMPIIALTANALRGEADRAYAADMDGFLTKPAALAVLSSEITKWIPPGDLPAQEEDSGLGSALALSNQAEGSPTISGAPPFDPSVLQGMVKDEAFARELQETYRDTLRSTVPALRSAAEEKNGAAVKALAHRLKGSSRSVGAIQLGDLFAEMENAGAKGDHQHIQGLMKAIEEGTEATFLAMEESRVAN